MISVISVCRKRIRLGLIRGCCLLTNAWFIGLNVSVSPYSYPLSHSLEYLQSVRTILPKTRSVHPLPHTLPRIHILRVLSNRSIPLPHIVRQQSSMGSLALDILRGYHGYRYLALALCPRDVAR
ncbi:hypothetical protein BDW42DRAFT_115365 [Aspergillus taichungensis]|uniref:Uncharacterized protein n=1 Tax=Aspergillus taichungensis TaxID=482145 RepID=A0A2J5HS91_9EURO|nr:hypothetical protein BDW42DRAFT_115365 [Aspergillus taichungensis]